MKSAGCPVSWGNQQSTSKLPFCLANTLSEKIWTASSQLLAFSKKNSYLICFQCIMFDVDYSQKKTDGLMLLQGTNVLYHTTNIGKACQFLEALLYVVWNVWNWGASTHIVWGVSITRSIPVSLVSNLRARPLMIGGGKNREEKFEGSSPGKKNSRGLPEKNNFKKAQRGKKNRVRYFLRPPRSLRPPRGVHTHVWTWWR